MKQQAKPTKTSSSGDVTGSTTATQDAVPEFTGDPSQAYMLQNSMGNAGVQELLASQDAESAGSSSEEKSSGLENYQALLGKKLGGKLYGALADQLTLDKVGGYAEAGLTSAMESLVGMLEDYEVEGGETGQFADALTEKYASLASDWVKANPQIVDSVRGWVDDHPGTVATTAVTVALLAAAAAILTDQKIPELKLKFNINKKLTAELSAKLGSLQHIALEQITAKLNYTSGNLQGALEVTSKNLEGVSGKASLSAGDETHKATLTGEFDQSGLSIYNFSGLWGIDPNHKLTGSVGGSAAGLGISSVTLETVDGKLSHSHSLAYDAQTDIFSLTDGFKQLTDMGTFSGSNTVGTDGSEALKLGYEGNPTDIKGLSTRASLEAVLKDLGASSAYDLSATERLGLGMTYTKDALKAELDASLGTDGSYSFTGSAENDLGGGHKVGGSLDLGLGDEKLLNVGAFYSYTDKASFRSFMAQYQYRSENDTHDMGFRVDQKLGEIYGRLEQSVVLSSEGQKYATTVSGAYFVDDDVALIGGVQYQANDRGEHNFLPQIGAQIGGVPLVVTYDPKQKGITVGITIPFGF